MRSYAANSKDNGAYYADAAIWIIELEGTRRVSTRLWKLCGPWHTVNGTSAASREPVGLAPVMIPVIGALHRHVNDRISL